MPLFDLSAEELLTYRITTAEPEGLDQWWAQRLDKARSVAAPLTLDRHAPDAYGPTPVWDAEFSGSDGDRIRGWYLRPAGVAPDEPLPVVVTFIGYGGGRGVPTEHMVLPGAGFANLVMDTRGQGGRWTVGATGDRVPAGSGPEYPGVMTRGIADPDTYYFSRLFTDAARAVDMAAELPGVDPSRLAVAGGSQGGGMALAVSGLVPDLYAGLTDLEGELRKRAATFEPQPAAVAVYTERYERWLELYPRMLALSEDGLLNPLWRAAGADRPADRDH